MCHSDESRPPAAPNHGNVGQHGEFVLTSADGTEFDAYEAHPESPSTRGIVILPDVRGLHAYYKDLADRFAEAGFHAVAIDYFARTAGRTARTDDFDYVPHWKQSTPDAVDADARAAADHLRAAGVTSLFSVGFCFGGTNSWRQSASIPGLKGAIGFYGRPDGVLAVEDDLKAPLLLLLGGADQAIDPASFDGMLERLAARGLASERHVYEGAPHSFFDRRFADFADACADAWTRILAFTDRLA